MFREVEVFLFVFSRLSPDQFSQSGDYTDQVSPDPSVMVVGK